MWSHIAETIVYESSLAYMVSQWQISCRRWNDGGSTVRIRQAQHLIQTISCVRMHYADDEPYMTVVHVWCWWALCIYDDEDGDDDACDADACAHGSGDAHADDGGDEKS